MVAAGVFFARASDGVELCYDDRDGDAGGAGAGAGAAREVIVFQHGYTSTRAVWRGVLEHLRATGHGRYRCICIDMRGCGLSGKPTDPAAYSIARFAADVVEVVDQARGLGPHTRFVFVGHSLGGGIGFALATGAHAARLKRLVLVTPMPSRGVYDPLNFHALEVRRRKEMPLSQYYAWRRETHARPDAVDALGEEYLTALAMDLAVPDAYYAKAWQEMADFRVDVSKITTPTLMATADCDNLLGNNLKDYRTMPNASLQVFARASHGLPRDLPAPLAAAIDDFVRHGVVTFRTLVERGQKYDLVFGKGSKL